MEKKTSLLKQQFTAFLKKEPGKYCIKGKSTEKFESILLIPDLIPGSSSTINKFRLAIEKGIKVLTIFSFLIVAVQV